MSDDVSRIKDRLDVVDIVGDYVRLTKRGSSYKGLCPFHQEKTPSFNVSQERQTWHCFGCGKGGDIFTFVMEKEGLDFKEALEVLAKRAGIDLENKGFKSNKPSLLDVMETACSIYSRNLAGNSGAYARSYLSRRNLRESDWKLFEIGWAPPSWDYLLREFQRLSIDPKEALKCGLVVQGDRGLYDRFRGRVIFPIRDISGRLVAFGGRILDGEGAKYLNSPETDLYSKSKTLYLMDKTKFSIREKGQVIIVEGYMDAISLYLHGFTQVAATLGTALTEEQASIIKRLCRRVYICYDSDQAGQEAAMRGMYLLQNAGLSVKVVSLVQGKDPDELLGTPGGDHEFKRSLDEALPLVDHHIKVLSPHLKNPDSRKWALESLLEGLSALDTLDVAPYLPKLAAMMGIRDFEVLEALRKRRRPGPRPQKIESLGIELSEEEKPQKPDLTEAALAALLWQEASIRRTTDSCEVLPLVHDERIKFMISSILSGESLDSIEGRWLDTGDVFPMRTLALGGAYLDEFPQKVQWKWDHFLGLLRIKKSKMRYNELRVKMLGGKASPDEIKEHEEIGQTLASQRDL